MKSMKKWARQLAESARAGETIPPHLLSAFAEHYLQLAEHADRQVEAVALFAEARAQAHTDDQRWHNEEATIALRALAQDARSGLHITTDAPNRRTYVHADGGLYEMLGTCEVKDDSTGDWDEGIAYRSLGMRREVLYVTSLQRFDDRFAPVEDPDQ